MAALLETADVHRAHARMLEEHPTGVGGELIQIDLAFDLLQSGQVVNCAIGAAASPEHSIERHWEGLPHSASSIEADVGPSLGVSPELLLAGKPRTDVELAAAEVLVVNSPSREIILGPDTLPDTIAPGLPAVVDFTDATGTYYLAGQVVSAGTGPRPRLALRVRQATLVQLRRFVRVPVLIAPYVLEVQVRPGEWRPVRGEIIDISLGGVGLLVEEPLLEDVHMRIEFELPGRFGDLAMHGRVVPPPGPAEAQSGARRTAITSRPAAETPLAHRRGVAFHPLTIDDLRRLQRALYFRQVELRRLAEPMQARRPSPPEDAPNVAVPVANRPKWRFWGAR